MPIAQSVYATGRRGVWTAPNGAPVLAPGRPFILDEPTVGSGSLTYRWVCDTMEDGSAASGITKFRLYYGTTMGQQVRGGATYVETSDGTTFSKTITGLTGGTPYWVAITAFVGSLEGMEGNEQKGTPS